MYYRYTCMNVCGTCKPVHIFSNLEFSGIFSLPVLKREVPVVYHHFYMLNCVLEQEDFLVAVRSFM